MNTIESRLKLSELSRRAIDIVQPLASGKSISSADSLEMREILSEAREAVYDAGFPGDAAWRALLHASVYVSTPQDDLDTEFWSEAIVDLQSGIEGLGVIAVVST